MEFTWLSRWQPQLLAILRIVAGLLFLEHGLSKFFGFPVPFPMHPLAPLFMAAGLIELVGGFLITIGLFTRLAAFIASGEMAVAYWTHHFSSGGFWPLANKGEAAALYCFIFLYLAAAGAGVWGIDSSREKRAPIR
ncbi:MAG TPA: DoxX family protein [Sphingomicrobium sp.]|jgi:putative oxidoreductase|nr:DoxX family protein [Sphingomicrobium sp.]